MQECTLLCLKLVFLKLILIILLLGGGNAGYAGIDMAVNNTFDYDLYDDI